MTPRVLYREDQHFSPWVFALCAVIAVIILGAMTAATRGWTEVPPQLILPVSAALLPLLLVTLFKIVTEVREDGIYVKLFPLPFRHIAFRDVRYAEVRTYRPLWEYGGWGLRYTLSHGWAYNARGNRGLWWRHEGHRRSVRRLARGSRHRRLASREAAVPRLKRTGCAASSGP